MICGNNMLKILQEKHFKKDIKKFKNNTRIKQLLNDVIIKLVNGNILEEKYKNHQLKGQWYPSFDCHIMPDLILVYQLTDTELRLVRLGSHSELFN